MDRFDTHTRLSVEETAVQTSRPRRTGLRVGMGTKLFFPPFTPNWPLTLSKGKGEVKSQ